MLAPLLTVALVALTVLALLLAGVVAAAVTGIVLLNVFATIVCSRSRTLRRMRAAQAESWQPSSFRPPPQLPGELHDDPAHPLTIHRR